MTDEPIYVVRMDRNTVSMWLSTTEPARWGPRENAMRFKSKGEGRRAAIGAGVKGAWSIQEV